MLKKILLGLAVLLLGFVLYVALKSPNFSISRSAVMSAPPEKVFPLVNDFHNWDRWSPWAKLDPNMKATFEGPDSGKGAVYKWSGNEEAGAGQMTIVESAPAERIQIKLDFIKPFESTCDTLFTFKPEGAGTVVTWTMSGKNTFIGRAICTFMNMDKELGGEFEKGLQSMKALAEAPPSKP